MAIKKVQIIPPNYTDIIHPETQADITKYNNSNSELVATNVQSAIDEIDTKTEENKTDILSAKTTLGSVAMTTTAQTVTGAINELDADTASLGTQINSLDAEIDAHKAEKVSDNVHGLGNMRALVSDAIDTGVSTTPHRKAVICSYQSQSKGQDSAIIASLRGTVNATGACIIASGVTQEGYFNENNGRASMIVASRSAKNEEEHVVVGGFTGGVSTPSTANRTWAIYSNGGNIKHTGVVSSGHNFTDFAELFPNLTGEKQGYGLLQTVDGHGVRPANEGERVVGVTSATAGIILGDTPFSWQHRWLKDEWGEYIYETITDDETGEKIQVPKENPEWDSNLEQISRLDRPEQWTVVGLVGQVYVRLKEDVGVMDYVKAWENGVGKKSEEPTSVQVMKITQEYDAEKGYKIGFCLLK